MFDPSTLTAVFSILSFVTSVYIAKIQQQQISSQKEHFANLKTVNDTYEKLIEVQNKNKESYIEHAQTEILDEFVAEHKEIIADLIKKELEKQKMLG